VKVMVVAPYYAPKVGGLENYARSVIEALLARGHGAVVVTSGESAFRRTEDVIGGVRVVRLPVWLRASNTPVNPLWYAYLVRLVRRERPDVILAHTPVPFIADLAARAAGRVPFVLTYHNDLAKESGAQRAIIAAYWTLLGHGTLERADRIIATSEHYAQTSPFLRPHAARVAVVPPGVDPERFHPDVDTHSVRERFGDLQIVLFVGSLKRSHAHKGLDLLMQAVAGLRDDHPRLHLVVVGQGDARPEHEARAADLGLLGSSGAITFTGFVADEDLPSYYAAADVFVLPSTSMAEGFGMVLLEASACGTTVIGTDVGGIPAALRAAGSPYLAEPQASSISRLLRSVLDQESRPTSVPPFTWDDVARQTEQVLVGARRPRVALIHNMIAPYRLELFEELAEEVNLRVLFTQGAGKDRLWEAGLEGHTFDARSLPSRMLGPVAYNRGGLRRLRRSRFDALVTNTDPDTAPLSLTGLLLARLRRRPVVVWSEVTVDVVRSFPALANAGPGPRATVAGLLNSAVRRYRGLFLERSSVVLAFSEAARSYLVRRGVRPENVVRTQQVVPVGLLPVAPRPRDRDGRTFLYVGYLTDRKNVALLIGAFRDLADPAARLRIAGSGPEETALRAQAGNDHRIEFLGYVDGAHKAELYASADVLVLPTRHDCWGLVVNEAIHYGLAVIVTETAGASELVGPERGVVVPSGDRGALTEAMSRLIADPAALRAVQAGNLGAPEVSDVRAATGAMSRAVRQALA
jgi:glycosyltransferase involved in cell wall biosynthesis